VWSPPPYEGIGETAFSAMEMNTGKEGCATRYLAAA
jgi:hypothetical protein